MVELDDLAGKIFSLLKGNGLQIKIFDNEGAEVTDPNAGRRFFVVSPNIMVTIDEDSNTVEFSKGSGTDDSVLGVQKNVRKLADQFQMNSKIKVFGKSIQPRDYSYQAKMKGAPVMENEINTYNHQLAGQIFKLIGHWKQVTEREIGERMGLEDFETRPIVNGLVRHGKIKAEPGPNGEPVYSVAMEETVMETKYKDPSEGPPKATKDFGKKQDFKTTLYHYKKGMANDDLSKFNNKEKDSGSVMESFSKMIGSLRTSQQTLENVRILVRHKTPVDETVRGARSRHIAAIFLECNEERFRFPHNYLPGARAMAQHLAHSGVMTDKVGSYIVESTGQLLKLQSFNRYVTTNKLINEDSSGIIETVKENIETLRTELRKITGVKTYETVKARLETFEREPLAEDDVSGLKELFTIRRFDEKFDEVLPIVKQLIQEKDTYHKRIEEAANNIVVVRTGDINTTPILEFTSDNARLGFMINELALRIVENDELSGFINKIGTKLCKEGTVNDFEKAVMTQVFENVKVVGENSLPKKDIKEAEDLDAYFDRFTMNFY